MVYPGGIAQEVYPGWYIAQVGTPPYAPWVHPSLYTPVLQCGLDEVDSVDGSSDLLSGYILSLEERHLRDQNLRKD